MLNRSEEQKRRDREGTAIHVSDLVAALTSPRSGKGTTRGGSGCSTVTSDLGSSSSVGNDEDAASVRSEGSSIHSARSPLRQFSWSRPRQRRPGSASSSGRPLSQGSFLQPSPVRSASFDIPGAKKCDNPDCGALAVILDGGSAWVCQSCGYVHCQQKESTAGRTNLPFDQEDKTIRAEAVSKAVDLRYSEPPTSQEARRQQLRARGMRDDQATAREAAERAHGSLVDTLRYSINDMAEREVAARQGSGLSKGGVSCSACRTAFRAAVQCVWDEVWQHRCVCCSDQCRFRFLFESHNEQMLRHCVLLHGFQTCLDEMVEYKSGPSRLPTDYSKAQLAAHNTLLTPKQMSDFVERVKIGIFKQKKYPHHVWNNSLRLLRECLRGEICFSSLAFGKEAGSAASSLADEPEDGAPLSHSNLSYFLALHSEIRSDMKRKSCGSQSALAFPSSPQSVSRPHDPPPPRATQTARSESGLAPRFDQQKRTAFVNSLKKIIYETLLEITARLPKDLESESKSLTSFYKNGFLNSQEAKDWVNGFVDEQETLGQEEECTAAMAILVAFTMRRTAPTEARRPSDSSPPKRPRSTKPNTERLIYNLCLNAAPVFGLNAVRLNAEVSKVVQKFPLE